MADMTEFLAFASQGSFTALPPSLPDQWNYLYFAFNTYLISAALSGNRIYGVIGRGTNPQKKDTNVTNLNYDIDCKGYDEQNVYNSWWYSGNYASAFNLDDFGHMNRNCDPQISNLLQSLTKPASFSSRERWPAMQPAFMASLTTLQSMQAGYIRLVYLILTWDMDCTTKQQKYEFVEGIAPQETFLIQNAGGAAGLNVRSFPAGYLWPLITQTEQQLRRT